MPTGSSVLHVVRPDVARPDAYDEHVAMVTVDGQSVGYVELGSEAPSARNQVLHPSHYWRLSAST